jgi:hypothetical protein
MFLFSDAVEYLCFQSIKGASHESQMVRDQPSRPTSAVDPVCVYWTELQVAEFTKRFGAALRASEVNESPAPNK